MPDDGGRARALDLFPELQQIADRLDIYEDLLRRWQRKINLVGPATLSNIWWRHFADSFQLVAPALAYLQLRESAVSGSIVDLGSGAGFPGLVLALALPTAQVTLVESDKRKAAFLREVSRETCAGAVVQSDRVEQIVASPAPALISSRAMASLDQLFAVTKPWLLTGSVATFLAGVRDTPPSDAKTWLCTTCIPSRTGQGFVVTAKRRSVEQT